MTTINFHQKPLNTGLSAWTTATEVLAGADLSGFTAIVTGGYSGLGLETVRVLANAGAAVIVPARSPSSAIDALAALPHVVIEALDLTDPRSIDEFAANFLNSGRTLDLLVNSAGIMATPLGRDARGNEFQFSTNHLGHFRLTARLYPALRASGRARVISVSSRGHQIAPVDFDDVNFRRRLYDKWVAYGQSKTANALFAVGLDQRGAEHGVRAYSLHPGSILGPLARHLTADEIASFGVHDQQGKTIIDPDRDLKTVEQGAATAIWCATSSQLAHIGGVYCENCDIARIRTAGDTQSDGVMEWAVDAALADRLWSMSEGLAGVRF